MNKIVYVSSYFKPLGKEVMVKVPTGDKKKGFLGGEKDVIRTEKRWEQTGYSDCEIDGSRLANDIQEAVSVLNSEGYIVDSIMPVTSGKYHYEYKANGTPLLGGHCTGGGYGFGYGYSITEGVVIVGRKHV